MIHRRLAFVLLFTFVALANPFTRDALDADEVLTVDRRGKTVRRTGTISDYKGRELILNVLGRDTKISSDAIRKIEADWSPSHVQADVFFVAGKYPQALETYRTAFRDEKRRWVKRRLLAGVVRCQTNIGKTDDACKNFARLLADDSQTVYFAAIPLAWQNGPTPLAVTNRVKPWLADDSRPGNQLMAASWLLNSSRKEAAVRILRELGRNEFHPIANLAVSQMWRSELVSLKAARLDWWQQHVAAMPVDLRAGSYYLLGLSFGKHGHGDEAALAFLRLPAQYPHHFLLTNKALMQCGETLGQSGDRAAAKRCYVRLLDTNSPGSPWHQSAREKLKKLAN